MYEYLANTNLEEPLDPWNIDIINFASGQYNVVDSCYQICISGSNSSAILTQDFTAPKELLSELSLSLSVSSEAELTDNQIIFISIDDLISEAISANSITYDNEFVYAQPLVLSQGNHTITINVTNLDTSECNFIVGIKEVTLYSANSPFEEFLIDPDILTTDNWEISCSGVTEVINGYRYFLVLTGYESTTATASQTFTSEVTSESALYIRLMSGWTELDGWYAPTTAETLLVQYDSETVIDLSGVTLQGATPVLHSHPITVTPGTHTVSLLIDRGSYPQSNIGVFFIRLTNAPVINEPYEPPPPPEEQELVSYLTVDALDGTLNTIFHFTASGGEENIVHFGDDYSSDIIWDHQYAEPGAYEAYAVSTRRIMTEDGWVIQTSTSNKIIIIVNEGPLYELSIVAERISGDTAPVTYRFHASMKGGDNPPEITTIEWLFGQPPYKYGTIVEHTFEEPGEHTILARAYVDL